MEPNGTAINKGALHVTDHYIRVARDLLSVDEMSILEKDTASPDFNCFSIDFVQKEQTFFFLTAFSQS